MFIFDIECYPNYALVTFLSESSNQTLQWEKFEDSNISYTILDPEGANLVGFNSKNYDMLLLTAMAAGWSNDRLYQLNRSIIADQMKWWEFEKQTGLVYPKVDHIDIAPILPLQASLKIYGGRIGSRKLQDLPIPPDTHIKESDLTTIRKYCLNDCEVTRELYREVKPQIELRERLGKKYNLDLRSKSDAQIAESVITSEYENRVGERLYRPDFSNIRGCSVYYTPPPFVGFVSRSLQQLLQEIKNTRFEIQDSGAVKLPDNLTSRDIRIGQKRYRLGIGGLHSIDGPLSVYADEDMKLVDVDVASYYPSIILNAGYFPKHMGKQFLKIYEDLVNQRLTAKHTGDKVAADGLKITVNGTFGKLGSKYSKMYSPDLMLHVTLTGQLCLLMLIELLPDFTISANTDGVMLYYHNCDEDKINQIIQVWEKQTGFVMEKTYYSSVHRRDVNNYFAIPVDPYKSPKTKGIFAAPSLSKNPANQVIIDATINWFNSKHNPRDTIYNCKDIRRFLTLRTVRGGAVKDGEGLGKSVRWYYSRESQTPITYIKSGNMVPNTENSGLVMDLPDTLPGDLDHYRYLMEARNLIKAIS